MSSLGELDQDLSFPVEIAEARALITARILESEDISQTKALKVELNNLTVVGQLPPEILANIFLTYLAMCHNNPARPHWTMPRLERLRDGVHWVRVSQVCHHWRQVSLHLPKLWHRISITRGSSFPELQLQRSSGYPLAIELHKTYNPAGASFVIKVLSSPQYYERLKTLKVQCGHDVRFMRHMMGPAPALESLSIQARSASRIPENLFAGGAPLLRDIMLDGYFSVPWEGPILRRREGLEHLYLDISEDKPSNLKLYSLLQASRKTLRTLCLQGRLWDTVPNTNTSALPPFGLPQLKQATLYGSYSMVSTFFESVQIPPSAHLHVFVPLVRPQHALKNLMTVIAASRPSPFVFKKLSITLDQLGSGKALKALKGWFGDSNSLDDEPSFQVSDHSITLPGPVNTSPDDFLRLTLQGTPPGISGISHLEGLAVIALPGATTPVPRSFWEIVGQIPQLKSLELEGLPLDLFAQCLAEDSAAIEAILYHILRDSGDAETHPPTPQRQFLALEKLRLTGILQLGEVSEESPFPGSPFDILTKNMKLRQELGNPLKTLDLRDCHLFGWQVDTLRVMHLRTELCIEN